ncbi:MAG: GntR family transcriptional regulator [Lactovum sp.]
MNEIKKISYESPMYLQLREVIRTKIEDREYLPGVSIPSESELMTNYGVNRHTVRNAIEGLVNEGLLKSIQGKGVYVLAPIERDLESLGGFTQTMSDKKLNSKRKVLIREKRFATKKYASIFSIKDDDLIYYIKRLDYVNDEAIAIQEIFIPYNLVPNIEEINLEVFRMFDIYKFYGILPKDAWQTLDLATLTQADARLINIKKEQAVFLFSCHTYDEENKLIEFSKSYTRGDKCTFKVHFNKEHNKRDEIEERDK